MSKIQPAIAFGGCIYRYVSRDPIADTVQLDLLTGREKQVLLMLGAGINNRVLARTLGIAERTVKAHTARVLHKLGLESRLDAAVVSVLLHGVLCGDDECVRVASDAPQQDQVACPV